MTLALCIGPMIVAVWLLEYRKRQERARRRSPLSIDLLRTPGHSLREKLDEQRANAVLDLALTMWMPSLVLGYLYIVSVATGRSASWLLQGVLLVCVAIFLVQRIRLLWRRSAQMDQDRLGLDAELAAGQELDLLMRQGAVVFHDLPGERFNVDHVVVAPQGVFAVETKGYRKPQRDRGADDARVDYDGKLLNFPDWSSDKPLQQAQRQARWLGQWLTSATGEPVEVTPVLALPGWFVNRKGRGPVQVFGRTELERHLLKVKDARPISGEQMQRVMHQVEQRCRDVKPTYRALDDD